MHTSSNVHAGAVGRQSSLSATDAAPWVRWVLIIGLPLLTAALAHLLFMPRQQTNDDVAMMMFASGTGISPEPTPYLLFMNPLPGQVLSSLYRLWPSGAWYTLFMLSARLFAGMGLVAAVLPRRPSVTFVALLTVWFVVVEIPDHVCPQFSITAAAAAQAAILLWLTRSTERPWTPGTIAAFLSLIGLGIMVRPDHALLVIILAIPLLFVDALLFVRGRPENDTDISFRPRLAAWGRRTGWPFLAACALAISLLAYQWWFYTSSSGWNNFFVFNALRSQITDLVQAPAAETDAARVRAGWSSNDLALIQHWFFADPEVYSQARLQAYLAGLPSRPVTVLSLRTQADLEWQNPILRLIMAAAVFPAFFLRLRMWPRYASVVVAAAVVWLIVGGVLHHYSPQHFIIVLLTFPGAVGIALAEPGRVRPVLALAWTAGASILVIPEAQVISLLRERSHEASLSSAKLHSQLRSLRPKPDQLYAVWGAFFPFEYVLPYDSLRDLRRIKMFPLGSSTNTPIADLRLRQFGISNFVTALYASDKIFVIADEEHMALLQTFIFEHRGIRVEVHSIFNEGARLFNVYQLRRPDAHSPSL